MKRVLVIGSNSFSGSDFIDFLLEQGTYLVKGVSRSPEKSEVFLSYKKRRSKDFSFHQIDLNHQMDVLEQILDQFEPEYIVNFAAQSEVAPSWEHPDHWFITNAVAITRLANMLKGKKYLKKYVHISSPEVYGACEGNLTEAAPLNPTTPYAASKAAGDLSLFTYFKNFNFPLVMIRSTNVYGAGQQLFKIIPRSILRIKSNQLIELHGGGEAIKSYIHIRDVSRGECLVMEHGNIGEIYHLSPDQGIKVKDVVHEICKFLKVSFNEVTKPVGERLGQDRAYVIDSSKARNQFCWSSRVTLEEGIQGTCSWIHSNYQEIIKTPSNYIHSA